MRKIFLAFYCGVVLQGLALSATAATLLPNFLSEGELQKQANFLMGSDLTWGDGTFQTVAGKMPKSYVSTNMAYWGEKLCLVDDCRVTAVVRSHPFSLLGEDLDSAGAKLQVERGNLVWGANIYDAATWQIAVALAAKNGLISPASATQGITNQLKRFNKIATRADAGLFSYGDNEVKITNPQYAYSVRMLANHFLVKDPLQDTQYQDYLDYSQVEDTRLHGSLSWSDWKPITGENAWAFLIGPMQSAYLLNGADASKIPFSDQGVQNALDYLWALQRMQSPRGAIYYAMNGSQGNTGDLVEMGTISNENNFSVLAGLQAFKTVLVGIQGSSQSLSSMDTQRISSAINVINIIIYGGKTPQGETKGLLTYFKDDGFDQENHIFRQGGRYDQGVFTPTTSPFAVDVNTWGVAALGPETVDGWFGQGVAYQMWQYTKAHGGYFTTDAKGNKILNGVGFTDQNDGQARVFSGEWTVGAINMLQQLTTYYTAHPAAGVDLDVIQADTERMKHALLQLKTTDYQTAYDQFTDGLAPKYQTTLPDDEDAFLYASNRYWITFGWWANPVPSTASTAWAVMLAYQYNPFVLGGQDLAHYTLDNKPNYDANAYQLAYDTSAVTLLNEIKDQTTQAYNAEVSVSYQTKGDTEWQPIISGKDPILPGGFKRATLPANAAKLSVAYHVVDTDPSQWYAACELTLTDAMREKLQKTPLDTAVVAQWADNGSGEAGGACPLLGDD